MRNSEASDNVYTRTITLHERDIEVEFSYYPELRSSEFDPGCEEELTIHSVWVDGVEITNLIGEHNWELIEKGLWKMHDDKGDV